MKKTFNVLIVGCGNIAGGYDLFQPEDALPMGHAKAYTKHGSFSLSGCVEPDIAKRLQFQQRWEVPEGYLNLEDANLKVGRYDVISICSPTVFHADNIKLALALKPKLIFCEKPVTSSLQETKLAVQACVDQNVLFAVNYSRRWSSQISKLKAELADGHWGHIRSVSTVYNKGILNNGSHMVDLLLYLFGSLKVAYVGRAVSDFFSDDPSIDATLSSHKGFPIQLNVANALDFAMFEMQIVTEKGVINMEDGGARWRFRHAKQSEKVAGYSFLNSGEWIESEGSDALSVAVANIFDALQSGAALASTGSNSIQAQFICEQIKQMSLAQANGQIYKKDAL
jgi:predicted dehydrogenase